MKLYVVIRKDLTDSQKAVQAGHALADFLRKNPNTKWDNGTLVYLVVRNENALKLQLQFLGISDFHNNNEYGYFYEPDLNNELTAFAVYGENVSNVLRNLRLL